MVAILVIDSNERRKDSRMDVLACDIARFLGVKVQGNEAAEVSRPRSLDHMKEPGALIFVNRFSHDLAQRLNQDAAGLVLALPEYSGQLQCVHILIGNPRLAFAQVMQEFFVPKPEPGVAATTKLGRNTHLGRHVSIGEYCVIGDDVCIGDNTVIAHHVVIRSGTRIGTHCIVKSHTVIGEDGFGFDFDAEGTPIRVPHIGIVQIGNHVEIGAHNTIAKATLDRTILEDYVKTDDQVHISHNVKIGARTLVIAGAEVSGSSIIGKGAWIGPNAAIIDKVKVGDGAMVGIGAVVTKDVGENVIVAGNPAVRLRERFAKAS
jgi:UDP-3-O-[3-hydroxymyristoyl] glucosamine N-acyltransferase